MHALSVRPTQPGSAALDDAPEPPAGATPTILLRALDIGVCGTDREILAGKYGSAPPGEQRLIIGHESLGEVLEAPPDSGFAPGDLAAAFVRRPDPVPCAACASGEWDMCKNGRYTERGIKQRHGYAAARYRVRPEFLVAVPPELRGAGVLVEPTSVVAKAWEQIERIAARTTVAPRNALITGAGPIGLLAALLGRQRGLEVHVFDRHADGPKPALARALGAHYHSGDLAGVDLAPDVVIECTGAAEVLVRCVERIARDGIVCLAGVSSGGRPIAVDIGAFNREMVLENGVIFGSVNANRRHYAAAVAALARWREAFQPAADDIKVVLDFARHAH